MPLEHSFPPWPMEEAYHLAPTPTAPSARASLPPPSSCKGACCFAATPAAELVLEQSRSLFDPLHLRVVLNRQPQRVRQRVGVRARPGVGGEPQAADRGGGERARQWGGDRYLSLRDRSILIGGPAPGRVFCNPQPGPQLRRRTRVWEHRRILSPRDAVRARVAIFFLSNINVQGRRRQPS